MWNSCGIFSFYLYSYRCNYEMVLVITFGAIGEMSLFTKIFKTVHCDTRVFVSVHPFDTQCRQRRISKFSVLKYVKNRKNVFWKNIFRFGFGDHSNNLNEKGGDCMNVCCSIQKKMFFNIQECFLRFLFLLPPLNFIFSFTN